MSFVENCDNQTENRTIIPSKIQGLAFPDVDATYHDSIENMLAHFANMCSGKLGDIDSVEHCIDITQNSRPSRSAPY